MTFLEGHPGSLGKKGEVNGQEVVTKRQQPWEGMGDKSDPTYPPLPSPLPRCQAPLGPSAALHPHLESSLEGDATDHCFHCPGGFLGWGAKWKC